MAFYDLDRYTERARALLAHGPAPVEHLMTHGLPLASIQMLQHHGVIRPKMRPWLNREGRTIGAIEQWQLARTETPQPQRLDCAVLDFTALGIS